MDLIRKIPNCDYIVIKKNELLKNNTFFNHGRFYNQTVSVLT